jgi:hypothetical protein
MQRLPPPPLPRTKKKRTTTPPPRAAVPVRAVPIVPRSQPRARTIERGINDDLGGQGHGAHAPVPYGSPGYKPVDFGAPRRHRPTKALSEEEVMSKRLGAVSMIDAAANPRIVALQSVADIAALGIPEIVSATRKHNYASAAAQAALFLPGGKLLKAGKVIEEGVELTRAARAARDAGHIKGPSRNGYVQAIRRIAPDKKTADTAIKQADAAVHSSTKDLAHGERNAAAQDFYRRMHEAVPAEHPIPGFKPVVTPTAAQRNLRSQMKPGNVQPAANIALSSIHPNAAARQTIGDISKEEWWARTLHSISRDPATGVKYSAKETKQTGLRLANWYAEMGPMMRHFFGDDADAVLRGFAVSQANASPAGGLTNVLKVRDKLLRGEPIKDNEISTVVRSIEAAYKGEPITKGMQAKLHDFSDALQGKTTRTWTADDIRGGMPTPVDIHALRDLGYVDRKILRTLQERHGLPVSHLRLDAMENELRVLRNRKGMPAKQKQAKVTALRQRIETFKKEQGASIAEHRAKGLVMDSSGVASTRQYNHAVNKYQEITDHLNEIGALGKKDWTPAEVQALGWSAIQRFHGTVPEDAQFMIDRNTTSIAFEVLNGKTGIGDGLSPAAQYAVTKEVADAIVPKLLADEGIVPRGELTYGLGGYEDAISPAGYQSVLASPEQVDRVVARLSNLFDQYDVWGVRTGVSISKRKGAGAGKAALQFSGEDLRDPRTVEAFWNALRQHVPESLQKHFKGFSSYTRPDGVPGIRVITEAPPVSAAKADAWRRQYDEFVKDAMRDSGITGELRYDSTNVEVRDAVGAAARTRGAPRVSGRGRVGDPLAAEAQSRLAAAVERHTGSADRVRQASRELHARGGVQFHDPHGLAHGIPVEPPTVAHPPAAPESALPSLDPEAAASKVSSAPNAPLTLGESVMHGLEGAPYGLAEEEALRSPERARRSQAFRRAAEQDPSAAGLAEASKHLAGKYPALHWGKFTEFSQEAEDAMIKFIVDHPLVKDFEVKRATDAIKKVRSGVVPRRHELKLLRQIFGADTTRQMIESLPGFRKLKAQLYDILNIPRAVMSSFDVSGAGRQGLMIAMQHPSTWGKNLGPMMRALLSKDYHLAAMAEIHGRENARNGLYERMGIDFTDVTGRGTGVREEAYASPLADKIPGVGMSSRAYTLFLDKARADLADHIYAKAQKRAGKMITRLRVVDGRPRLVKEKIDPNDDELLQSIGTLVNSSSGRGDLGNGVIGSSADGLNLLFFSPRLAKSRIDFLNPVWYARLHPVARRQAYWAMGGLVTMMATTLTIAHELGASVELDPRSSDFAKIKVGNARLDLAGGFQQYLVLLSRIATQQTKQTSTGNVLRIGGPLSKPTLNGSTDLSVLMRFLRGKLAPVVGGLTDVAAGENIVGDRISVKKTLLPRVAPLSGQDAVEVGMDVGKHHRTPEAILAGFAAYMLGAAGVGVQDYEPKAPPASGGTFGGGGGFGGGGFSGGGFGG